MESTLAPKRSDFDDGEIGKGRFFDFNVAVK